jgi:manganese efflux pump family protein
MGTFNDQQIINLAGGPGVKRVQGTSSGNGMLILYIIIISVSLAVDAFAASLSCGLTRTNSRFLLSIKVSTFFGLFQFTLFLMGWMVGSTSKDLLSSLTVWLAFLLLLIIGARMIFDSLKSWNQNKECLPLSNRALLLLSLATSIDALVVGLTFGFLGISIIVPALIVGSVTFLFSLIGVLIGHGLRGHLDKWAEIGAGLVLIGLGIRMLIGELF